jgi:hypothetical protein
VRLQRVLHLASSAAVELMAHPVIGTQTQFLLGARFGELSNSLKFESYAAL